ncbi:MAG TPA: hypothetical protein VGS62_04965 [Streptosporangiaceae bacterium]|nr:hypothetical protein [Streptosporangiaceae bacterium]
MPDTFTYYAILDDQTTPAQPIGLVRRREFADGGFADEGLHRDLNWHRTPAIVEWEHGNFPDELMMVSEEEAERIIERFRERWVGNAQA